ncbi:Homoserine O-acetyltransferase [Vanrija pseudolonga]|uniref:Homoserine O-acetyltransferase n=1 Tax=Vanrija pseudolonga TaxID=143232 RepID=A0AAF0Y6R9_9TREE|nr:Homoserine O-acetyltransferase [Vanrija pseudolonga]
MTASTSNDNATNPYSSLIDQEIAVLPTFTFESGVALNDVPVAYKTWGKLNAARDNCMVICHALTGSADVEDWWGPLLGPNRAFDPTRFFIFCGNVIGSPYGTVSSVTTNPATGRPYGPEMPGSTAKDDVRLHYQVLKQLGVESVAAVIGGSMGGITTLEWPLNTPPGFVKAIVPLATSARHSAWCISWGEAQRQSIYSDPDYKDGYYYDNHGEVDMSAQPTRGLAAARMAALLTYRSRDSFESRFGRKQGNGRRGSKIPHGGVRVMGGSETTNPSDPSTAELDRSSAWREHNDGHRSFPTAHRDSRAPSPTKEDGTPLTPQSLSPSSSHHTVNGNGNGDVAPLTSLDLGIPSGKPKLGTGGDRGETKIFNAQSYLRYQGDKFTSRFDANCYIHITRKLDTHDLSHPSVFPGGVSHELPTVVSDDDDEIEAALFNALSHEPPALVIGIESDGLFQPSEQRELAAHIPDAELVIIPSPDGHDGFLLEFEAINGWVDGWLRRKVPSHYGERVISLDEWNKDEDEGFAVKKESVFGEAEADVTRW